MGLKHGWISESAAKKFRCPEEVVVRFTKQLSTLLKSGIPFVDALEILTDQPDYPQFGEVIEAISLRVQSGHPFSACLNLFPRVFSEVYVTMVAVGERTGHLDRATETLGEWLEEDYDLKRQVKAALTYPAVVISFTLILTLALFYTVMPGFIDIFRQMNVDLPWPTRVVMAVTKAIQNPGSWIIGFAVLFFFWLALRDLFRNPRTRLWASVLLLRVPLIGGLLKDLSLARYTATAAALIAAGLDLTRVFLLSARASGSQLLIVDSRWMLSNIEEGRLVSDHMAERPDLYPATVTQMVIAGEESSRLEDMFERLSSFYDSEVRYRVEVLGAALEPLLLMFLAGLIGGLVFSIMIPLYSYLGKLG